MPQALDKGKSLSWVLPQAKIKSPPLKKCLRDVDYASTLRKIPFTQPPYSSSRGWFAESLKGNKVA